MCLYYCNLSNQWVNWHVNITLKLIKSMCRNVIWYELLNCTKILVAFDYCPLVSEEKGNVQYPPEGKDDVNHNS